MKLGDFLKSAGARPICPRPVEFTATNLNGNFQVVKVKVKACFIFVNEDARQNAIIDARESLKMRFGQKEVPQGTLTDEIGYHILFEALREAEPTKDGNYEKLCTTMLEFRSSLVLEEATRLYSAYANYVAEEFPSEIDQETWNKLLEEAKKNSLESLLSSYGYANVLALTSFLSGRSPK